MGGLSQSVVAVGVRMIGRIDDVRSGDIENKGARRARTLSARARAPSFVQHEGNLHTNIHLLQRVRMSYYNSTSVMVVSFRWKTIFKKQDGIILPCTPYNKSYDSLHQLTAAVEKTIPTSPFRITRKGERRSLLPSQRQRPPGASARQDNTRVAVGREV